MQWYPGDWLKDPAVRMCSPAARGVWFDLLNVMWTHNEGGEIEGTVTQLARAVGCFPDEMIETLNEVAKTGAADVFVCDIRVTCHRNVTACHEKVTVINRRMKRENDNRVSSRERKRKQRDNETVDAFVTPDVQEKSRSLSSSSTSVTPLSLIFSFEDFWSKYPNRKGKGNAEKWWHRHRPSPALQTQIRDGLERAIASAEWAKDDGRYIPHPTTWLNARGWEDDYTLGTAQPREPRFREVN